MPILTKAELDEIRASHTDPLKGPNYLTAADGKPVLCHQRIHSLLDHIDAMERSIAAHKRDEADSAEMELAAYENGRREKA